MATQIRGPISDIVAAGTWSGTLGQRWQAVDDYPDAVPVDALTHTTPAGHIKFGFSPFAIPAGSTAISVQVLYYDYKIGGAQAAVGSALRLGSTPTDHNAATHNPGNGVANITARSENYATNPKSGAAWTVNDINGQGTNFLVGFGWRATDSNPGIVLTSIRLQVTYTAPPNIFTKAGRGAMGMAASGVKVLFSPPPSPPTNLRRA